MGKGAKKPRVAEKTGGKNPAVVGRLSGKSPAGGPSSTGDRTRPLRFRFDQVDLNGPWCPSRATREEWLLLLDKLRVFETMTVNELFHVGGGDVGKDYADLADCPNPRTLRRLEEIQRDDIDALSRLRLGGRGRLYGVRGGYEFSILWWDPRHEVWPSRLKHT